MKEYTLKVPYREVISQEELGDSDRLLIDTARRAMDNAYAPYSNYHVGCAVQLENGQVVTGSNQENMAYPSGLCAERVALFAAGSNYPGIKIVAMAICASPRNIPSSKPSASCGACRQVMLECEMIQQSPYKVFFTGQSGPVILVERASDLLPLFFREDSLKK